PPAVRESKGDPPRLVDGVIGIGTRDGKRIGERGSCLLEGHLVLLEIRSSLPGIPGHPHRLILRRRRRMPVSCVQRPGWGGGIRSSLAAEHSTPAAPIGGYTRRCHGWALAGPRSDRSSAGLGRDTVGVPCAMRRPTAK